MNTLKKDYKSIIDLIFVSKIELEKFNYIDINNNPLIVNKKSDFQIVLSSDKLNFILTYKNDFQLSSIILKTLDKEDFIIWLCPIA